jgi:hypothetical protein
MCPVNGCFAMEALRSRGRQTYPGKSRCILPGIACHRAGNQKSCRRKKRKGRTRRPLHVWWRRRECSALRASSFADAQDRRHCAPPSCARLRLAGRTRNAASHPHRSAKQKGPHEAAPSSFGGGGGNRTRVREPSAPGSTCLSASIDLTERYPTGREDVRRSRMSFNRSTPGELHGELVRNDAWYLDAQARLQPDGTLLGFKQRVRSCRRWQL